MGDRAVFERPQKAQLICHASICNLSESAILLHSFLAHSGLLSACLLIILIPFNIDGCIKNCNLIGFKEN